MGVLREDYAERHPVARRSWFLRLALVGAAALAALVWYLFVSGRESVALREFASPELGCKLSYPARLFAGPNFLRSRSGAFMTIERHSLLDAEKQFVNGLPDSLYRRSRSSSTRASASWPS